ncbi:hypothetical protein T03_5979 [Trichinella britovi]|uniref:Uncharacterized protein n=1 Tax=Trichinella britovi TaxID=45882 RepID=A0A0V1D115_TRIBR|nr:hypothetical protein T03_5979 [Trichinella britovi]
MKRYHARESSGDRRHHQAAGTSAACGRLPTRVRDEGQKADTKTTATRLPAGLHPLRKVLDERL